MAKTDLLAEQEEISYEGKVDAFVCLLLLFGIQMEERLDSIKKLLVKQDRLDKRNAEEDRKVSTKGGRCPFARNPDVIEYGNQEARIIDFTIVDEDNLPATVIEKGEKFSAFMKVEFARNVQLSIFSYRIKDLEGTEITGTTTMYEETNVSPQELRRSAGDTFYTINVVSGRGIFVIPWLYGL